MKIFEVKVDVALLNDIAELLKKVENTSNPIEKEAVIAMLSQRIKTLYPEAPNTENARENSTEAVIAMLSQHIETLYPEAPNTENARENSTETDPKVSTSCCFGFSKWR